jgi:hypothetical protein
MTKIIILGEPKPKKPIEPKHGLMVDGAISDAEHIVMNEYRVVELICRNYGEENKKPFDLFFAMDNPEKRDRGVLLLGSWNDGVVE